MMDRELTTLRKAVLCAGAEALRLAQIGFETHTKSDRSPVTSADLAVNSILRAHLSEAFPEDGWLSEESQDSPDRLEKRRVWIVDPIDGTRAFVRGLSEYCISVALVDQGRPVVCAVFNPATGEWFSAIHRRGMTIETVLDQKRRQFEPAERPVVLVNPWELSTGRLRSLESHVRCRPIGSIAYALALVAAGQADAAIMLEGGNEWDIAAGVLLVLESGGRASNASGHQPVFNQPNPRQQGAVALSRTLEPGLLDLLEKTVMDSR
jgi:myo-inositol-1(or 4)-monophosphatase